MNLGPQKISTTYPYVINKSGSAFTLGDGGTVNWADAEVVVTSGNVAQTIGGSKTFTSNLTIPSTLNFTSQGSFVKAGNHAVTLNTSAAPTITFASTNARTYTIPDPGNNASFIMSTGNQNISGVVTAQGLFLNGSGIQLNRGQLLRWGANGESTDDANIVVLQNAADQTSMRFRIGDVSDANDTFVFERGNLAGGDGADLMTIRGDGNVGIGTSSPSSRLHVSGADGGLLARFEGGSNQWQGISIKSPQSSSSVSKGLFIDFKNENDVTTSSIISYNNTDGSSDLTFATTPPGVRDSDRRIEGLHINQDNNVGIGTNNPLSKLHVNGDINLSGPNKKLILYSGGLTNNAYIQADSAGQVSVYNGTTSISKNLTILSNGNVGIGNDSPISKLDVSGVINSAGLRINNTTSSDTSIEIGGTGNVYIDLKTPFSDDYDLRIQALSGVSFINTWNDENLIFNNYGVGNIGIATSSPTSKLDVSGIITASGLQLVRGQPLRWGVNGQSTDDANIVVLQNAVDQTSMRFRIGDISDSNDTFIFERGNGAGGDGPDLMTIRADGNVGIGTGNPAYKLDVIDGQVRVLNRNADSAIEVGAGTPSNQNAYIDLVGDTTHSDYGLRIIRGNTGPNTFSNILHRGTGKLTIGTENAGFLALNTSGQERLTISGNGAITANGNLQVNGRIQATDGVGLSNSNAKLQLDRALTPSNTFIDITGLSLTSGTWLVNSSIVHTNSAATAEDIYTRISGSSTIYASSMQSRAATANLEINLSMTTIIPLTTTTTITLQAASSAGSATSLIKKDITVNSINQGNNASQITAVRIA